MPEIKKQKSNRKDSVGARNSTLKSVRKAPGTRLGTLEDWREGSTKSGKPKGRHGQSIRDGR